MLTHSSGDPSPAGSSIIRMPAGPILVATQHEQPAGSQLIRSRRNNAMGIELLIQNKAGELMWDWTLFVNPFPDPITLTEKVHQCWSDVRRILSLPNFADPAPHSSDLVTALGKLSSYIISATKYGVRRRLVEQIRGKHCAARSQYLHWAKKVVAALYKLDTEDQYREQKKKQLKYCTL